MPAYLNVETIQNAAELINTTLITKGHTEEKLKFVTVDWAELISDQPDKESLEKLTIQEAIYNNDKNVVNAIYSLVQEVARHNRQHEASNQVLAEKDAVITKLERQLASAELLAAINEKKLARLVHIDSPARMSQIEELKKKNRAQAREILRVKNLNTELESKYEVEKRRMAWENSELKNAVLHSRGLSNTISYGMPFDLSKSLANSRTEDLEVNTQMLHYNKASVNNSEPVILTPRTDEAVEARKVEDDAIATQLLEVLERLMAENSKFTNFIRELTSYMDKVNASITPEKVREENGPVLVDPTLVIDMKKITSDTNDGVFPFELMTTPLLRMIYRNYEAISTLVDMAVSSLWESENRGDNPARNKTTILEEENKVLSTSLEETLKALEELRKFRRKH